MSNQSAVALFFPFHGAWRRVFYVGLYEFLAVVFVTLALMAVRHDVGSAGLTAVGSSTIAVIWNWVFNAMFERWEARQPVRGRSARRRVMHALGFEGGLAFLLIPFMAWTLHVGLAEVLVLEAGLLLFFLIYTFVFTWVFDRLFGLPLSAQS